MNELTIVRQAILNEVEGRAFYEMAAAQATNLEVKAALQHLGNEEKEHEHWLRSLNRSLQERNAFVLDWDKMMELAKVKSPGIFDKAEEAFQFNAMELAMFGAGLLMEKNSIDFYQKASKEATSPEAKRLYDQLVQWETVHLDHLEQIHERLRDEWWEKQQFSPS